MEPNPAWVRVVQVFDGGQGITQAIANLIVGE